jgi:hypothetical protein
MPGLGGKLGAGLLFAPAFFFFAALCVVPYGVYAATKAGNALQSQRHDAAGEVDDASAVAQPLGVWVTGGVRSPTAICHLRSNGVIQVHDTVREGTSGNQKTDGGRPQ